jgi:hypothetical protein
MLVFLPLIEVPIFVNLLLPSINPSSWAWLTVCEISLYDRETSCGTLHARLQISSYGFLQNLLLRVTFLKVSKVHSFAFACF